MNKRKFLTGFLVAIFALMACVAFADAPVTYQNQEGANAVAFRNSENTVTERNADVWVASQDNGYHAYRFWYDPNKGTLLTDPENFRDGTDKDSTLWYLDGATGELYVNSNDILSFDVAFFRGDLGLEEKFITVSGDRDSGWVMSFTEGSFAFNSAEGMLRSSDANPGSILFAPCCGKTDYCCLDLEKGVLHVSGDSVESTDVDVMVYFPCHDAEKRWQLTPYDKRVHFDDLVLVNPAELKKAEEENGCEITYHEDENVSTLFSSHFLYLGPYVVEINVTSTDVGGFSGMGSSATDWQLAASTDYLAERVLNFSPYGMLPSDVESDRFDWHRVVETAWNISVDQQAIAVRQTLAEICDDPEAAPDWDAQKPVPDVIYSEIRGGEPLGAEDIMYRARRIASTDTVGDYDGVFAQYLLYEDDVVSHDNWFSYVAEAHANLKDFSLSPGFAQYLAVQPGVDGCQWASTTNFKSSAITTSFGGQAARAHMVYGVRGEDKMKPANVENFCEYTEIGYRHWWERPVCDKICKEDVFFDDDECWIYTPMNVDLATWVEVFDFVNVASDDVDYFQDCDYTCGGVLGWYHDDQARNIKDYLKVEDPDAHVCLETEFGLQVTELSCNPDTGIIPIKVEFLLREEDQVCCNDAKTAIRNKLDLLGAKRVCSEPGTVSYRGDGDTEDRPIGDFANLAPVDAFLSEGGGDLLQLIFMGRNGVPYDLVKIANDYFEGDSANYPWLGAKNFFRVWPQTLVSGDVTDDDYDREMLSVKEAWLGGEQLEFSFYAVFVGADPAPGGDYVVARSGYFVIYTGAPDPQNDETRMIDGKVAVVCNWDGGVSPTPPPAKTPEIVSITSDPQGSVTDVACVSDDELTKDSFSDAAWTSILTALSISDEDDYLYDVTCKDCDDYVVSLDAGLSLDVKVTYEEGEPAPAAGTYRSVFVKDVANSLYDVLAAEELAIAVEKDVQGVIFEGGDYDADASDDTLKAGFCLLQVVATPKTDTPTTTPSGDGGSSGCSFGFAPLALLLLAPLALLRK